MTEYKSVFLSAPVTFFYAGNQRLKPGVETQPEEEGQFCLQAFVRIASSLCFDLTRKAARRRLEYQVMLRVTKKEFPLAQVYGLLEPGPVVLVTTACAGRANVMPMSWHTMMEFVPPIVGCVISNLNYTFETLRKTGACVINVPTAELVKKAVACGNASGQSVDKFKKFGLTPLAASVVKAPLIAECYANLECKVIDRKLVTRYNFFVLEVVQAWIDSRRKRPRTLHHQGEGVFVIPGRTIKLPSPKTSFLTA